MHQPTYLSVFSDISENPTYISVVSYHTMDTSLMYLGCKLQKMLASKKPERQVAAHLSVMVQLPFTASPVCIVAPVAAANDNT